MIMMVMLVLRMPRRLVMEQRPAGSIPRRLVGKQRPAGSIPRRLVLEARLAYGCMAMRKQGLFRMKTNLAKPGTRLSKLLMGVIWITTMMLVMMGNMRQAKISS